MKPEVISLFNWLMNSFNHPFAQSVYRLFVFESVAHSVIQSSNQSFSINSSLPACLSPIHIQISLLPPFLPALPSTPPPLHLSNFSFLPFSLIKSTPPPPSLYLALLPSIYLSALLLSCPSPSPISAPPGYRGSQRGIWCIVLHVNWIIGFGLIMRGGRQEEKE